MDLSQLIFPTIYSALAVLAAVICIAVGCILLHVSRKNVQIFFPVLFLLMTMISITDVALSGRSLTQQYGMQDMELGDSLMGATKLPAKLMLALLIGFSVVSLVARLVQRHKQTVAYGGLLGGLMIFYVACAIVPAVFGYKPLFSISLIYIPLILCALFLSAPADPMQLTQQLKIAMSIIVLASLATAVVAPSIALQQGYHAGLIPGFDIRLWGLASHANVLGPVALTLLILELSVPLKRRIFHQLLLCLAGLTIILTQSKTSLAAGSVALLIILGYRFQLYLRGLWSLRRAGAATTTNGVFAIGIAALLLLTLAILGLVLFLDYLPIRYDFFNRKALEDMESGTGRTSIWAIAISEGWRYPLFGYGLSIWDPDFRYSRGVLTAFHAHNQLLQIFSVAGFFGLMGFIIYLFMLGRLAWRTSSVSGGATVALFSILLIRSIAEVPLQIIAFTGGDFMAHLAFVFFLGACERRLPATTTARNTAFNVTRSRKAEVA
ncbi:MAG: O-antigen ligase family protein [Nitrosospira sp.]|nr:O-antigen ligase family protein [Nitrosospira sp.]